MKIKKFVKKPIIVEAVQWTGKNIIEIKSFTDGMSPTNRTLIQIDNELHIETLEGIMRADKGDFIIKGIQGEFYPCKPDIFKQTYQAID